MTPLSSSLRLAEHDDNAKLIHLARSAPMEGGIRVYADRAPDFFQLANLQGEDAEVLVYEDNGEILGSIVLSRRHEVWFGQPRLMLHAGDLRVSPAHRSSGIAKHLISQWLQEFSNGEYLGGGFEILNDNRTAMTLLKLRPAHLTLETLGICRIFQVLPLWPHRTDSKYEYRTASLDDLPELARVLSKSHEGYNGYPEFTQDYLKKLLQQHESFSLDQIWLAERGGRILACAGFWDQQSIRRTIVENFSPSIAFAVNSIRVARPILRLPKIPRPGDPLRYGFIRFPAHLPGEKAALHNLLRHMLNHYRSLKQYQFIWASFHENDSMQSVLNGLTKLNMEIRLFHSAPVAYSSDWSQENLLQRVPYVDFSLV